LTGERFGDEGMMRVGVHGRVCCHCVADAALSAKLLLSARCGSLVAGREMLVPRAKQGLAMTPR
jgi:hypothetical protein